MDMVDCEKCTAFRGNIHTRKKLDHYCLRFSEELKKIKKCSISINFKGVNNENKPINR